MKKIVSHVFNGKKFKIDIVSPSRIRNAEGKCDNPEKKDKKIVLSKLKSDKEFLRLAVHEALHALWFSFDEETIEQASEDLSNFLWRLGYKRIQEQTDVNR